MDFVKLILLDFALFRIGHDAGLSFYMKAYPKELKMLAIQYAKVNGRHWNSWQIATYLISTARILASQNQRWKSDIEANEGLDRVLHSALRHLSDRNLAIDCVIKKI